MYHILSHATFPAKFEAIHEMVSPAARFLKIKNAINLTAVGTPPQTPLGDALQTTQSAGSGILDRISLVVAILSIPLFEAFQCFWLQHM